MASVWCASKQGQQPSPFAKLAASGLCYRVCDLMQRTAVSATFPMFDHQSSYCFVSASRIQFRPARCSQVRGGCRLAAIAVSSLLLARDCCQYAACPQPQCWRHESWTRCCASKVKRTPILHRHGGFARRSRSRRWLVHEAPQGLPVNTVADTELRQASDSDRVFAAAAGHALAQRNERDVRPHHRGRHAPSTRQLEHPQRARQKGELPTSSLGV